MGRQKFSFTRKRLEKFEAGYKLIALNVLLIPYKKKEITQAYISKHNSKHPNHVILFIISDIKK